MCTLPISLLTLMLTACGDEPTPIDDKTQDLDGDGQSELDGDCNDGDATVYEGADEVCDEVDNDCDGDVDEEAVDAIAYITDADGDGFGDESTEYSACDAASENDIAYAEGAEFDCDDSVAEAFPGNQEVCDEIDNDCNDLVDDDASDVLEFYVDSDGDGYGDSDDTVLDCSVPEGYAVDGDDCDDNDPTSYPEADEVCDEVDNNCDGVIDYLAVDGTTYYADADADGHGDPSLSVISCIQPDDYVLSSDDCDDSEPTVYEGADEVCDELDNNCDGLVDDDDSALITASATEWFLDSDEDGYGTDSNSIETCIKPAGYSEFSGDCDDSSAAASPGNIEVCDGVDQDCDGIADDKASDGTMFYVDADGDGYGTDQSIVQCIDSSTGLAPDGFSMMDGDCDDSTVDVNPDQDETCDGIDNNCSGDESDASDTIMYYIDSDGDGQGDLNTTVNACEMPLGTTSLDMAVDCDDSSDQAYLPMADVTNEDGEEVYPALPEICDDLDNDCNGLTDEADENLDTETITTFYLDADGDGFAVEDDSVSTCVAPEGYIEIEMDDEGNPVQDFDCDDNDDGVFASLTVTVSGVPADQDEMSFEVEGNTYTIVFTAVPDGSDDSDASFATTAGSNVALANIDVYDENDVVKSEGDIAANIATILSSLSSSFTAASVDENALNTVMVEAAEAVGGTFDFSSLNSEAGIVLTSEVGVTGGEQVNPNATEYCDGIDNDCNELIDDDAMDAVLIFEDLDGDGFGSDDASELVCDTTTVAYNFAEESGDCDDSSVGINPDGVEDLTVVGVCSDGIDQDCDGDIDCDDSECSGSPECAEADCTDGIDNDGDGALDCDDTECQSNDACVELNCSDGVDNDYFADGDADNLANTVDELGCDCVSETMSCTYDAAQDSDSDGVDDLGCDTNTSLMACTPGLECADLAGDGLVDCDDPDCADFLDCYENSCSDGVDNDEDELLDCLDPDCAGSDACGEADLCLDGLDNDGDGATDCQDSECMNVDECFSACLEEESIDLGSTIGEDVLSLLEHPGAELDPDTMDDDSRGTCSLSTGGVDTAFTWTAPATGCYQMDTESSPGLTDTVLYVREGGCYGEEVACSEDEGEVFTSLFSADFEEGVEYTIIIDGYSSNTSGEVVLDIITCPENTIFDDAGNDIGCSDGLDNDNDGFADCADEDCLENLDCTEEDCTDGLDEDGDTLVDCADPDCTLVEELCYESDCSDGLDNEDLLDGTEDGIGDGLVDCQDDECAEDYGCQYGCIVDDLTNEFGADIRAGTNAGGLTELSAPTDCASDSGGEEVVFAWIAPETNTYTISTEGSDFDTVLYLKTDCLVEADECNDEATSGSGYSELSGLSFVEGEEVLIVVDAPTGVTGQYNLSITPDVEMVCNDGDDTDFDGLTDCEDSDCVDSEFCTTDFDCEDGLDNDGDTLIDCDDTDDCGDAFACNEQNCTDGIDGPDGDGLIDCDDADECAMEPSCVNEEVCPNLDLGDVSGTNLLQIDNTNASNDYIPSDYTDPNPVSSWSSQCSGGSTGLDYSVGWTAPVTGCAVVDTEGSATTSGGSLDTVLLAFDGCEGEIVECDDDSGTSLLSLIQFPVEEGEDYLIVIDGYSSYSLGEFNLNIEVNEGTACEDADEDGVLDEGNCFDGIDNDGNGLTDCEDAACSSNFSCNEQDCSDGLDGIDQDGLIDCDDVDECATDPACYEVDCNDGVDNEIEAFSDGLIDCDDDDCAESLFCTTDFDCEDGLDNDGDGLTDCEDEDCSTELFCYESDCTDGDDEDGDELVDCDDDDCAAHETCFEYECDDTLDDDGDELIDCDDPDCAQADACVELVCDDGIDDEGDGLADCQDEDCFGDSYCFDYCVSTDLNDSTGTGVATGENYGAGDLLQGSCSTGQGTGGEEAIFYFTPANTGTYTFTTNGTDYDTVLYIKDDCVGEEIACNDDTDFAGQDYTSTLEDVFLFAGQSVVVVVDSYEEFEYGTYNLDIIPTFEPDCSDGLDNDNDGLADCDDMDCMLTVECANTSCPSFTLGDVTGNSLFSSSLDVAPEDVIDATCSSQGGQDLTFEWTAPDSGCLTVDTQEGTMDTILVLYDDCPSAGGTELACDDDAGGYVSGANIYTSLVNYDVVAGQTYYIGVDSWSYDQADTFILDVNLQAGTSCP